MRCPRCDHDKTYVLKTTLPDNKPIDSVKQRRRECSRCKLPFMTFEIQEADFARLCDIVKREGPTRSPLKTRTPNEPQPTKS